MNNPVSGFKAFILICRFGLTRWFNKIIYSFSFRNRKNRNTRLPSNVKRTGSFLVVFFLIVFYGFFIIILTSAFVSSVSNKFKHLQHVAQGKMPVSRRTYTVLLRRSRSSINRSDKKDSPNIEAQTPDKSAEDRRFSVKKKGRHVNGLDLDSVLSREAEMQLETEMFWGRTEFTDKDELKKKLKQVWREKGINGFYFKGISQRSSYPYPSVNSWVSPYNELPFIKILAFFMGLIFVTALFFMLGWQRIHLKQVDWDMKWLFTFPVSSEVILYSKLTEYTLTNIFWIIMGLVFFVVYWCAGFGWFSVIPAIIFSTLNTILLGGLRILSETFIRLFLKRTTSKNVQALFTVLTVAATLFLMIIMMTEALHYLVKSGDNISFYLLYLPVSWGVLVCIEGASRIPIILGSIFGYGLLTAICIKGAAWMTKDGLIKGEGAYTSERKKVEKTRKNRLLHGLVGKDIRLLLRDRNIFVQTFLLPLAIIAYNLLINYYNLRSIEHIGINIVSAVAFWIGAYVLAVGMKSVLSMEQNGMWLLYSIPQRLDSILIKKSFLWVCISLVYPILFLAAFFIVMAQPVSLEMIHSFLFALLGLIPYSFIATGLGILGSSPWKGDQQGKIEPSFPLLYMVFAGGYGSALISGSAWNYLVYLILALILSIAVWQKVRDNIPYMMDPAEKPEPAMDISTGIFAVFSFSMIMGIIYGIGSALEPDFKGVLGMFISYVVSGTVVISGMAFHFWRKKVGNIFFLAGLISVKNRFSVISSVLIGLAGGIVPGFLGILYLFTIKKIYFLNHIFQKMYKNSLTNEAEEILLIVMLGVLFAPVIEEYLFRAVLFRSLQRSCSLATAMLLSAGLFAIIHPPFSCVPVFFLGLTAAYTFNITNRIMTPIISHMAYNTIILSYSLGWVN